MAERRPLTAGLATPAVTEAEREFVYRDRGAAPAPVKAAAIVRAPFTTRLRDDFVKALKRASLERQMSGLAPNTLQEIVEEAVEPWLRDNGYLRD